MRPIALLVLSVLAGCATGPSRSEVLASLVGHNEADVLRALGAPNRILEANGSKFYAYDERRLDYAPAPGFAPFGPFGYGYFGPSAIPFDRTCETTVEISDSRVRTWNSTRQWLLRAETLRTLSRRRSKT